MSHPMEDTDTQNGQAGSNEYAEKQRQGAEGSAEKNPIDELSSVDFWTRWLMSLSAVERCFYKAKYQHPGAATVLTAVSSKLLLDSLASIAADAAVSKEESLLLYDPAPSETTPPHPTPHRTDTRASRAASSISVATTREEGQLTSSSLESARPGVSGALSHNRTQSKPTDISLADSKNEDGKDSGLEALSVDEKDVTPDDATSLEEAERLHDELYPQLVAFWQTVPPKLRRAIRCQTADEIRCIVERVVSQIQAKERELFEQHAESVDKFWGNQDSSENIHPRDRSGSALDEDEARNIWQSCEGSFSAMEDPTLLRLLAKEYRQREGDCESIRERLESLVKMPGNLAPHETAVVSDALNGPASMLLLSSGGDGPDRVEEAQMKESVGQVSTDLIRDFGAMMRNAMAVSGGSGGT